MPIVPSVISTSATTRALSKGIFGKDMNRIASAVASASVQYILATAFVTSVNNVVGPGAGISTGRLINLSPKAMSGLMNTKALTKLMAGRDIRKFFDAISFGVVTGLRTAISQGAVIGGAPGTGIGNIVGLVSSGLQGLIVVNFLSKLMAGRDASRLASAIAFGITFHLTSTVKVSLTNIGAFAPPPAGPVPIPTAPGTGKLI